MGWRRVPAVGVAGAVMIAITAGFVLGAGTTTVAVQPDSATVTAGETATVDIVVESADDGVGSIDLELAVSDSQVANITDVSVAGNPETVRTNGGNDSTRIAATGMDTDDTGTVTVATVTLTGESAGTSSLDLTVAAVGNESGSAYTPSGTTSGELTVEGGSTPTDTATPTSTEDSDDGGGDVYSGGVDTPAESPTPTPTATPTPTPTPTSTSTPTPTPTATATPATPEPTAETATQSPSATGTATDTAATEPASPQLVPLAVIGGLVILVAGLIYYQRG